ncbi:hypothetical protein WJX73_004231 [Symbiochloris irregularis]|uniref:Biotin-protein ligase N-terminal domain-containing protein n=1 Tax=Symbiochloris irregularis TaxID=706552 RepID=A0AAW1Q0G8_9CHLO
MSSPSEAFRVLVYAGKGAGTRSVLSAVETLRGSLQDSILVAQIGAEDILSSRWQQGCLLLVMPGGADLPYCQALNGKGNELIRDFVETGGAYLGLCAGAYYGCSRIEFELGTPLEVRGSRELKFFGGVARGGVFSGFKYMSEAGAVAAPIACCELDSVGPLRDASGSEHAALPPTAPYSQSDNVERAAADHNSASADGRTTNDACEQFYDYSNGGPKFGQSSALWYPP